MGVLLPERGFIVGYAVPPSSSRNYSTLQRRLLPHAQACSRLVEVDETGLGSEADRGSKENQVREEQTILHGAILRLGNLYTNQGKLDEAEKMYDRALQGYEKALGIEHTSTLTTVNNLGLIYSDQGKLDEAEKMYQRALEGYEKALGAEHTSTLATVNNLGNLYADQGKLDEAEKMYQRALQGYEKALGTEHTSTLRTVNNLGVLYKDQGKLDEAEKMFQRALQGYEKALGAEHTSTLKAVNNLGLLYGKRCCVAAKVSACNIVLVYIKHLASLCTRFPRSRPTLLGYVGRAFAWIGDDEKSAAAFAHQFALSSPAYDA